VLEPGDQIKRADTPSERANLPDLSPVNASASVSFRNPELFVTDRVSVVVEACLRASYPDRRHPRNVI
jgi:hypothetical protein